MRTAGVDTKRPICIGVGSHISRINMVDPTSQTKPTAKLTAQAFGALMGRKYAQVEVAAPIGMLASAALRLQTSTGEPLDGASFAL